MDAHPVYVLLDVPKMLEGLTSPPGCFSVHNPDAQQARSLPIRRGAGPHTQGPGLRHRHTGPLRRGQAPHLTDVGFGEAVGASERTCGCSWYVRDWES